MHHPTLRSARWTWPWLLAIVLTGGSCTRAEDPEQATPSIDSALAELGSVAPRVEAPPRAPSVPSDPTTIAVTTPARSQADDPWTRVVWTRDVGAGTDIISFSNQLILIGYDSRDGRGERVLLKQRANYAKPLITPSGKEVVYTLRARNAVFAIPWGKRKRRHIADGFALAVWLDPATGHEWVYVGRDEAATDPPSYHSIHRYRLSDPGSGELVWNAQPVSGDGFQLSADGRYAGGLFPWPRAGVADLAAGTWRQLGEGCWTAFSGDGNSIFWYFDGAHRNLTLVDVETEQRWQVNINGAPGIDGFEVWHPRWANDSRYLVMTGPYTVGRRANKIRGGGTQVEIWLGEFLADFSSVKRWRQITNNDVPDFYPDAWIEPSTTSRPADTRVRPGADAVARRDPAVSRLVMEARVKREVPVPTPESIAPYKNGLHALDYEVVRVIEGDYDESTLVVAHWIIRDGEVLNTAQRSAGSTHRLTVELYDSHSELEGERLVMDTAAFTLPLYYDVESLP